MQDLPRFLRPAGARVQALLVRRGVPANALTWCALIFAIFAALAFAWGRLATGGVLFLASGTLDLLDGRVARASGAANACGALLDSVCDRYAELLIYGALVFHFAGVDSAAVAVTLAALGGSFLVSYTRARAEALGVSIAGVGLAPRPERIIALSAGALLAPLLGPGILKLALALIAAGANATAISRFRHASRALAGRPHVKPPASVGAPRAPLAATSSRPSPG